MTIKNAITPDIVSFAFPENIVDAFTKGDCWEFARTIAKYYSYPVITAAVKADEEYWNHAANLLPDGTVIDIEGIWSPEVWIDSWHTRTHTGQLVLTIKQHTYREWLDVIDWDCLDPMFPDEFMQAADYASQAAMLIPAAQHPEQVSA